MVPCFPGGQASARVAAPRLARAVREIGIAAGFSLILSVGYGHRRGDQRLFP
jgi:hypothetical protein